MPWLADRRRDRRRLGAGPRPRAVRRASSFDPRTPSSEPSFGLVPFVGWDTAVVARRRRAWSSRSPSSLPGSRPRAGGGARRPREMSGAAGGARRLPMIALAAALAGGSVLCLLCLRRAGSRLRHARQAGAPRRRDDGASSASPRPWSSASLAVLPRRHDARRAPRCARGRSWSSWSPWSSRRCCSPGWAPTPTCCVWESAAGCAPSRRQYSAQATGGRPCSSLRAAPGDLRPAARAGLTRAIVQAHAARQHRRRVGSPRWRT